MTTPFGATILGCRGLALTVEEKAFFRDANPFGLILFSRNVDSPDQVRALTADMRDCLGRDAPVFVDQEGGRVQRLRAPHWREYPPMLDLVAQAGGQAERAVWLTYRLIAAELLAVGIDGNCAPCLDIAGTMTHPVLRNRCLGQTAAEVSVRGRAAALAHLAGGVLPVIKHMPGHGRGSKDSHHDLPFVQNMKDELQETDFAVFKANSDVPLAMTAHVVYGDIDDTGPATTSPRMIRLIREEIGFDGLLMTDDLSMNALAGDVATRARNAIAAGCDVILHCNGHLDEMRLVAEAAGAMSPQAQGRALAALAARKAPEPVDIAALESDLAGLTTGQGYV